MNGHTVIFGGACPFLSCSETGRHEHPICPKCGAVNYGNLSCAECRFVRAPELQPEPAR